MGPLLIAIRSRLQRHLQRESLITRICTSPKSHVLSDIQCIGKVYHDKPKEPHNFALYLVRRTKIVVSVLTLCLPHTQKQHMGYCMHASRKWPMRWRVPKSGKRKKKRAILEIHNIFNFSATTRQCHKSPRNARRPSLVRALLLRSGGKCGKIGFPGKLILSKRR